MTETNIHERFTQTVLASLEETFENVHGMYLDEGTSLFETLATISAEEASIPVSENCATIAAHVAHIDLSIETIIKYMNGERPEVDWGEIWRTVREVTPKEWEASQAALRASYDQLRELVSGVEVWGREMGFILAILMHNAYHLGEIRHALCTVKA